jgi:hypothetical protein
MSQPPDALPHQIGKISFCLPFSVLNIEEFFNVPYYIAPKLYKYTNFDVGRLFD